MKLHIIGSIFDSSGYSSHTRQLSNALYKLNPNMSLDVPKQPDWVRWCNDAELKMINTPYSENSTIIMISPPPTWRLAMAENPHEFYGFLIWEGSNIPISWLKHLSDPNIQGILVPSVHVKVSILNTIEQALKQRRTGFNKDIKSIINKIYIVPHGVDTTLFKPIPDKLEKVFTFISCKGWSQGINDRGGIQYVLKAFHKEFDVEEKVQIIVKINPVYNMPGWSLDNEMTNLGIIGKTNIKINFDNVTFDKLPILYNRGHCFVSATRCDAFNLPGLEAMACGLPVISTGYGGQIDYMTNKNSLFVKYKLEEVTHDINYEGSKWATPNLLDLRKKMRYAFEHQNKIKELGEQALKDAQKWSWKNSAKKLLQSIQS